MQAIQTIGRDWLVEQIDALTEEIIRVSPSAFNELNRYLPPSVTGNPGFIRFSLNPFMREILDCASVESPIREVNIKKGVQITYTTLLESIIFYYAAHIKTAPMMYITADNELAASRIELNMLPMFNQSGFADIIKSSDEGNKSKTGKTKKSLQFEGGGYLLPFGARNADKMRNFSILLMLKDELDAWPWTVGNDGDPDGLTDARCDGFPTTKKIIRGSTPLIKGASKIDIQYERGDCRKYHVLCKSCSFPQELRWSGTNKETGHQFGFQWDYDSDGMLEQESVRYSCADCGHDHYDYDKEVLFATDQGAHWKPTKKPVNQYVRSYHLPALYSPMKPWHECVALWLEGWDPAERKVKNKGKYQVFYNNILAKSFKKSGSSIHFTMVSAHRRTEYLLGQVPNALAREHTGGRIELLTCQVDVHKSFLAVAVMGWTRDMRCYLIDYHYWKDKEGEGCKKIESHVWGKLRELLEEKIYTADDGTQYKIIQTFVDSGYVPSTVVEFCKEYDCGVHPIIGRDESAKQSAIKEFKYFKTQSETIGYRINVDYYKDRLAIVFRRDWVPDAGQQKPYHFNAPTNTTDDMLKELTVEVRVEKVDDQTGLTSYTWFRPSGAKNELWDLSVYGHCSVEVMMWDVCMNIFEQESVDSNYFWDYVEREEPYIYKG